MPKEESFRANIIDALQAPSAAGGVINEIKHVKFDFKLERTTHIGMIALAHVSRLNEHLLVHAKFTYVFDERECKSIRQELWDNNDIAESIDSFLESRVNNACLPQLHWTPG